MVGLGWVLDEPAADHVLYSRAIVGELAPGPLSPLTATAGLGAEVAEAWRRAYQGCGFELGDQDTPVPRFGSHLYLDTRLLRMLGEHATGADPFVVSRHYVADRSDVPRQHDTRSAPLITGDRVAGWATSVLSPADAEEGGDSTCCPARESRPDLASCEDAELVARFLCLRRDLRRVLTLFAEAELATMVSNDQLARLTEHAGHPELTGVLVAGHSGTLAGPVEQLWQLAGQVAGSDTVARRFDRGVPELAAELAADSTAARRGELGRFRAGLDALRRAAGFVGPAEWELSSETWETDPRIVLRLVDVLRRSDEVDPAVRAVRTAARAAATAESVRTSMGRSSGSFVAALGAAGRWLRRRERLRRAASMVHHEQRLAARQLAARQVASGVLDSVGQIFLLRGDELAEFVRTPAHFVESIRMREYDYCALSGYQPPFVATGPPVEVVRWPRYRDMTPARRPKTMFPGTTVSAGRAVGAARTARGGTCPGVLPGDILVLPSAGPSWVPVLTVASGVVVDTGGALSDVAVACRDLGIPCVVGAVDASRHVPDGAVVEVNGGTGMVKTDAASVVREAS